MKKAIKVNNGNNRGRHWPTKGFLLGLGIAAACMTPASLRADNLFWDANGAAANVGGSGTWDTTSPLWRLDSTTGALQTYTNSSGNMTANFAPTAGTVTIASGTAVNANLINVTANYTIAGGSGSSLNLDGTAPTIATGGSSLTIGADITGSAGLIKTGAGTLTLNGNNSFTGGFTWNEVNNFVLSLGNDNALGSNALTFNGGSNQITIRSNDATAHTYTNAVTSSKGAVVFGATSTFTGDLAFGTWTKLGGNQGYTVNNSKTTLAGYSSSGGTITKGGAGNLIVSGNWTQTGATALTISAGALAVAGTYSVNAVANLGNTSGTDTTGVLGRNGSLTAAVGAANGVKWTGGASASNGGLFAYGGNATWGNAANNLIVNFGGSGAMQTWGTTTNFIASGKTLIFGNALSNGTVDFQNALNLGGAAQTIRVDQGATNLAGGADAKLSGVISNGGLTKTGAGTMLLTAINTYTGNTAINGGTLQLADNAGLSFVIGATGVNNMITGNGTGSLLLDGDFTFDLTGAAATGSWTIVDVANLLETYGSNFAVNGFTEIAPDVWQFGNYTFTESTGLLTAVPEPSTYVLLTAGLGALALLRRRRKA